jgi:hypothetical protein
MWSFWRNFCGFWSNIEKIEKALPEAVAEEPVEPEKPKRSVKIPIDFACPLQADCHSRPKTCDKLQEHLRLRHKMEKGHPFWPTAETIKNGKYKELLNAHDLLFPNQIEDEDIVPSTPPPKTITYIRTKRGGISLTSRRWKTAKVTATNTSPKILVIATAAVTGAKDARRNATRRRWPRECSAAERRSTSPRLVAAFIFPRNQST